LQAAMLSPLPVNRAEAASAAAKATTT